MLTSITSFHHRYAHMIFFARHETDKITVYMQWEMWYFYYWNQTIKDDDNKLLIEWMNDVRYAHPCSDSSLQAASSLQRHNGCTVIVVLITGCTLKYIYETVTLLDDDNSSCWHQWYSKLLDFIKHDDNSGFSFETATSCKRSVSSSGHTVWEWIVWPGVEIWNKKITHQDGNNSSCWHQWYSKLLDFSLVYWSTDDAALA